MIISAMMMIGISLVLFIRSPIRMPAGERAFRRIWLGPIGRGFLALASRGVDHAASVAKGTVHAFAKLTPSPITGVRPVGGRTPLRTGSVAGAPSLSAASAATGDLSVAAPVASSGASAVERASANGWRERCAHGRAVTMRSRGSSDGWKRWRRGSGRVRSGRRCDARGANGVVPEGRRRRQVRCQVRCQVRGGRQRREVRRCGCGQRIFGMRWGRRCVGDVAHPPLGSGGYPPASASPPDASGSGLRRPSNSGIQPRREAQSHPHPRGLRRTSYEALRWPTHRQER